MEFTAEQTNMSSSEKLSWQIAVLILSLVGLYFTSWYNYLLFHMLAEFFSIVVAMSIFVIAWHSRYYNHSPYLLFIGIAYLFIAALDLLHALSYKGMAIFTDYDYYANQLWIGARYMESITLCLAFYYLKTRRKLDPPVIFSIYALITATLIASIFYWQIFPVCFIEGSGLTPFKKISEYIISLILGTAIYFLVKNRNEFETRIFKLLLASLIMTIISELAFTFYISNYGISNLVGHYFKIFSFYLIYLCIIKTGIEKPYNLIFKDLNRTNQELKAALNEIKSLRGILPICSSCKKIRDDQGYWNQLERYLETHADVKVSHGLCRSCADELYGGQEWYRDGVAQRESETNRSG